MITGEHIAETLGCALAVLCDEGFEVSAPDWGDENACLERFMCYTVTKPHEHRERVSLAFSDSPEGLAAYVSSIVDGTDDHLVVEGKRPYEYHERIAGQIPLALAELQRNASSRRAVMVVARPEDLRIADGHMPCLRDITLHIRGGALNMYVHFRSNDAWNAAFENDYALTALQMKLADELGVTCGTYTKTADSFHVYKRDFDKLRTFAKSARKWIEWEF